MSLLLADYGSSSSEDESKDTEQLSIPALPQKEKDKPTATSTIPRTVTKSKKKSKKRKKSKISLAIVPQHIQEALEKGQESADSDEERHRRRRLRRKEQTGQQAAQTTYLPQPKHRLLESKIQEESIAPVQYDELHTEATAPYPIEMPTCDAPLISESTDVYAAMEQQSSKKARNRDREIERALQQGNFDVVNDQITEIHGAAPDEWQPPEVDALQGLKQDVKISASFWNTKAGAAVSSGRPSRLQRQKHQLNQLAYDAKVREFDLMEMRGQGIKTKRETQAKYGW